MSGAEAKPEGPEKGLASDDDVILGAAPDPDMEAAMSQVLAPVVARATNGAVESDVIEVSSAGEARTSVAATRATPEPIVPEQPPVSSEDMKPPIETPLAQVSPSDRPTSRRAQPDSVVSEAEPTAEPPAEPSTEPSAEPAPPPEVPHTERPERTPELPVVGSSPFDSPPQEGQLDTTPSQDGPVEEPPAGPTSVELQSAEPPEPTPEPPPVTAARASELAVMAEPSAGNRVYDHLVEGDDDVIGLITYSLYEKDRRDWLQHWQRQHGADPTADQFEAFVEAQLTFSQRDRYRSAARQVLDAYASVAVDLEKPVIIRDGIAGRVEDAAKRVEGSGRWWRQLPAAVVGGIAAALVIAGIIAILVAAGVDIAGYLGFEQTGAADGLS